jgi:hypothetical protein
MHQVSLLGRLAVRLFALILLVSSGCVTWRFEDDSNTPSFNQWGDCDFGQLEMSIAFTAPEPADHLQLSGMLESDPETDGASFGWTSNISDDRPEGMIVFIEWSELFAWYGYCVNDGSRAAFSASYSLDGVERTSCEVVDGEFQASGDLHLLVNGASGATAEVGTLVPDDDGGCLHEFALSREE